MTQTRHLGHPLLVLFILSSLFPLPFANGVSKPLPPRSDKGRQTSVCRGAIGTLSSIGAGSELQHFSFNRIKTVGSKSIALIEPKNPFTAEEIREIKRILRFLKIDQIHFTYSSDVKESDIRPFYSTGLEAYNKLNPSLLPISIYEKLENLKEELKKLYKRSTQRDPSEIMLTLRRTSNTYGFSVNRFVNGDSDGLHDHMEGNNKKSGRNNLSLVWALKGKGARIKFSDGIIREVSENIIAVFGVEVKHGSPDSDDLRYVIIGSVR